MFRAAPAFFSSSVLEQYHVQDAIHGQELHISDMLCMYASASIGGRSSALHPGRCHHRYAFAR